MILREMGITVPKRKHCLFVLRSYLMKFYCRIDSLCAIFCSSQKVGASALQLCADRLKCLYDSLFNMDSTSTLTLVLDLSNFGHCKSIYYILFLCNIQHVQFVPACPGNQAWYRQVSDYRRRSQMFELVISTLEVALLWQQHVSTHLVTEKMDKLFFSNSFTFYTRLVLCVQNYTHSFALISFLFLCLQLIPFLVHS